MKRSLTCLMVSALAALAQGPHGPAGTGTGVGTSLLDLTQKLTISGTVSAVDAAFGMAYPSITVNKIQIKTAPVWCLLEKGFEIKVGDAVSITAAPSRTAGDAYLYAIDIVNTTSKLRIVLRNSNAVPLWIRGNGMGGGPMGGGGNECGQMVEGGCVDVAGITAASGTVDKISSGYGIQMPTLTLQTSDGKLLNFKLGPERIFLAADTELKVGDKITIRYAVETCTDELIALTVTTAMGATIHLRNDDGTPAW